GLLQHDLRNPHPIGRGGVLPGQVVAAVLVEPGQQARGEVVAMVDLGRVQPRVSFHQRLGRSRFCSLSCTCSCSFCCRSWTSSCSRLLAFSSAALSLALPACSRACCRSTLTAKSFRLPLIRTGMGWFCSSASSLLALSSSGCSKSTIRV